jgi:hypothetical protein
MQRCDEQLLSDYAHNFLGYGSLNSPVWLIGPEAGGGKTKDEIHRRASIWAERGRKETEDLQRYHDALGIDWTKKIQPTWGALIRILLALQGRIPDKKDVLEFQRNELGKLGGQNCVLDLSQLSSPSASAWPFQGCGIGWLNSREEYEARVLPLRCHLLQQRLLACEPRPKLVLFYGHGHQRWWKKIANSDFKPSGLDQLSWSQDEGTLFAMMPHRNGIRLPGKGALNGFFANVGVALREKLGAL